MASADTKPTSELYSNSQEANIKLCLAELAAVQEKERANEEAEADELKRKRKICESERQLKMARLEVELREKGTTGVAVSEREVNTLRLDTTATDGRVEPFRGIQVSESDGYSMLYDPNNEVYPGKMYIMTFANSIDCDPLPGIEADVAAVTKSFKQMKFEVSLAEDNLTSKHLEKNLEAIAGEDFSKYSSLICMFNGHGTEDSIVVRDGTFKVDDIFDIFHRCRNGSLVNKPKIFIFDACRGTKVDHLIGEAPRCKALTYNCDQLLLTAPKAADYLTCYAVSKGYVSFEVKNGSPYIQELTKILDENFQEKYGQNVDLLQLLTKVSAKVAKIIVKKTADNKSLIQMPCFVSSLRQQLYLPTTSDIGGTQN